MLLLPCLILLLLLSQHSYAGEGDKCVPFPSGCESYGLAYHEAVAWLYLRMPVWDEMNSMTLFGRVLDHVDGLDTGLVAVGVNSSLTAKSTYPWSKDIEKSFYYEYNTAYSFTNEPRTDWRQVLDCNYYSLSLLSLHLSPFLSSPICGILIIS